MSWEGGKIVSGVWIHRNKSGIVSIGVDMNAWVRFQGDNRGRLNGWMRLTGDNRDEVAAMLNLLSDARQSGNPVAVDITGGFAGVFFINGVSA